LGEVFVARDEELNREVALKQLREALADDADSRDRFLREAELTGRLEHPGIVPVYGLGTDADGRPYYAMRFIRGETLYEAIRHLHRAGAGADPAQQRLELRLLLGRFLAACNAMAYAHQHDVVHRDLKPQNIMLGEFGETLLVDWGLAKVLGRDEETWKETPLKHGAAETLAGSAIGTPAYMSPEAAAGRLAEMGKASDVYSLGATLFHLLTGQAPFPDDDSVPVQEVLRLVQRNEFPLPSRVDPAVPPALEQICIRALAQRPADRYPSVQELATDLERWLADEKAALRTDRASETANDTWINRVLAELRRPDADITALLYHYKSREYLPLWQEDARLFHAFAWRLIREGDFSAALDLVRRGLEIHHTDPDLEYLRAEALARIGSLSRGARYIRELLLRDDLVSILRVRGLSLAGRIFLDLLARTDEPRARLELARQGFSCYEKAYVLQPDPASAFGAACMAMLAGEVEKARSLASEAVARVQVALQQGQGNHYWLLVTLGEAQALLGDPSAAGSLRQALRLPGVGRGDVAGLRRRLRLLGDRVRLDDELLEICRIGPVVVFSGPTYQPVEQVRAGELLCFPPDSEQEREVSRILRQELDSLEIAVGYCSVACGADLLFAEERYAGGPNCTSYSPSARGTSSRSASISGCPRWPLGGSAPRRSWRGRPSTTARRIRPRTRISWINWPAVSPKGLPSCERSLWKRTSAC
jgi:serine/threonine protein kinase